jgi:hypothetical protein
MPFSISLHVVPYQVSDLTEATGLYSTPENFPITSHEI